MAQLLTPPAFLDTSQPCSKLGRRRSDCLRFRPAPTGGRLGHSLATAQPGGGSGRLLARVLQLYPGAEPVARLPPAAPPYHTSSCLQPTSTCTDVQRSALYSAARLRYSVLVQRFMIPTFQPVLLTLIPHSAGFRSFLDGSLLPSWILVYVEDLTEDLDYVSF
jgi:hypothetical protein